MGTTDDDTPKVSPETVMHDWKLAKVWLTREMSGTKGHEA